jgi:branched-chain amino acid aminotransferase
MPGAVQLFAVVSPSSPQASCLQRLPDPTDARTAHEGVEQLGLAGSVYTAFRTFEYERFLALDEHLDRTLRSMQLLGWADAETVLDRTLIRRALAETVNQRETDSMVRLDILAPDSRAPGTHGSRIMLTVAPLGEVPQHFIREGVRVELAPELARERPHIKTAEFVLRRRQYPLGKQEAFEHLLLDPAGNILEATSANVYVVLDDVVHTAGHGVLEGITRLLVLRVAQADGIDVSEQAVPLTSLTQATEMFLTSSTRGVVPIVNVAGTVIGQGQPGPLTQRLAQALNAEIARIARPAWPHETLEAG